MRKSLYVAFLALVGAFLVLETFDTVLGWGGRAPDVVYGDEMNFPEGIVLLFVAMELYRRNSHAKFFAALLAILNGVAMAFDIGTLSRPIAFSWAAIWTVIFAAASWPSMKRFVLDSERKQPKTA